VQVRADLDRAVAGVDDDQVEPLVVAAVDVDGQIGQVSPVSPVGQGTIDT
jgi:hypothetical protein